MERLTMAEWAIRKADEVDPEAALTEALVEKLVEMAGEALSDSAINMLTAGNFEGVMRLMDIYGGFEHWLDVAKIIRDTSRRAGSFTLSESLRAAVARRQAQLARNPVLVSPGGVSYAPSLPEQGILNIAFDALDSNIAAWSDARSANLVVQIVEDMRMNIRSLIGEAVRGSATAQETAQKLARIIPLHSRYAKAVANRERTLFDSFIQGGMDAGKARLKAKALADKYALKLTRLRARTIARTEIQFATNHGQYIGYETAMNSGAMQADIPGSMMVTKEWVTAEDEDVCKVCGPLNGQQVGFGELFPIGVNHPPAHPNCRCSYNIIDNLDQYFQDRAQA